MRQIYKSVSSTLTKRITYGIASTPKNSYFSDYMGLTDKLIKLRQQVQKIQKNQVRRNTTMLIAGVVALGTFILLIAKQSSNSGILQKINAKLKLGFASKFQNKMQIIKQNLEIINAELRTNPYEYKNIVTELINYMKTVLKIDKQQKQKLFWQQVAQLYAIVLKKNFKARQGLQVKQGVALLIQQALILNFEVQEELFACLLIGGSIRQVYLAVRYCLCQQKQILNKYIKQIEENLGKQKKTCQDHYAIVTKTYGEDSLPQIDFKKSLQAKWLKQIAAVLKIQI